MSSSLQLGINAAKAGHMQEALGFLKDAIIEEPQNAEVWVWIAAIIDDMDKQAIFLEKALEIDPHNIPAQRGLAYLEKRKRDDASVKNDHLSDHTRPISPFPTSVTRNKADHLADGSKLTVAELGALAHPQAESRGVQAQPAAEPSETDKLTPFEIGLIGVVALVFCIIGLLAASALFDFDLPTNSLFGERSALASEPPYPGVFLYEDEMFFIIQRHEGLPSQDMGIPVTKQRSPIIVLWQTQADRDQMKLIYETGEYIPIRKEQDKNEVILIRPAYDLQAGLYCFQQLNETGESQNAYYWCFIVEGLVSDDT
jgi:hypothetical protein